MTNEEFLHLVTCSLILHEVVYNLVSLITWRVDGIDCGHNQTSFYRSKSGDGELGDVWQTDGNDVGLLHVKPLLKSQRQGSRVVSQLGECVLSVSYPANL